MPSNEYERSEESAEMARIGAIGSYLSRFMVFTSWQLHADQRETFIRELRHQLANFGEAIDELEALFAQVSEQETAKSA